MKRRSFFTNFFGLVVTPVLAEKEIKIEPPKVDPFSEKIQKEIEELKARHYVGRNFVVCSTYSSLTYPLEYK